MPGGRRYAPLIRLQKHVDKGNANAQIMLGTQYRDGGMGLQQNFKRAARLYERAAAQGHADAQMRLGHCYEFGNGVKIDCKTAAQWYRRAADQGYPDAQYNLGLLFRHGEGVAQSHDEAVRWFRLAAAQGHPSALFNLGVCYANGQGVTQDLGQPLKLRCQGIRRRGGGGRPAPGAARGHLWPTDVTF